MKYRLLDCGDYKKVEMLGDYKFIRPCPQACWKPFNESLWLNPDVEFVRTGEEKGVYNTISNKKIPESWVIENSQGLAWNIEPNEFGNIGVFTEHWMYAYDLPKFFGDNKKVLNLFTYSGSNCVNLVRDGFNVTAVDSSKVALSTYTRNLEVNDLSRDGQRLILEDCFKFISREERRDAKYDGIMIDAPSYGRGTKGEVFKIEDDIRKILETCKLILSPKGKIILTLHSPRFTPEILRILVAQIFEDKNVTCEEILNVCESGVKLPSGMIVKVY
ncbi:MAG: class I SAM-dependent methyltransferase [Patescibacteria group bacterium]